MSILDHAVVKNLHMRLSSNTLLDERAPIMFQEETDLGAKFDTDHERHIYRIDVVVGVEFTANSAQYEHAKRNAELVLLHRIYGDILGDMAEITKAVYDNDGRRIINICSKIKDRFMERTT